MSIVRLSQLWVSNEILITLTSTDDVRFASDLIRVDLDRSIFSENSIKILLSSCLIKFYFLGKDTQCSID